MKRYLFFVGIAVAAMFTNCKKSNSDSDPNAGNTGGTSQTKLAVTDFTPNSGKPGTTVTITGTGFGTDVSAVKVAMGELLYLTPVSVTPTTIIFKTNDATATGKVNVFINGNTVSSTAEFTALPPDLEILSISGNEGYFQLGGLMTIYGQGFGADTNKISISFGGTTPIKPFGINSIQTYMTTTIPRYAPEGKVTVTVNGTSITLDSVIRFNTSIKDFSPKTFHVGDTVKITGFKFTSITDMSIDFNNYKVTRPIKVTPTQMLVIVPYDAKSGFLRISANLGTLTDVAPDQYVLLK